MSETDPETNRHSAGEVGVHSQLVEGGPVSEAGDTLNESLQRVVVVWRPAEIEEASVRAAIERDREELARTVGALADRLAVGRRARERARRMAGRVPQIVAVAAACLVATVLLRRLMGRDRRRWSGTGD
ncbi:DUF3618 domain-containing protein [Microtetraspora sp. NBRC 16547]|uniref:DUF3618 domain-containing protein n=1 Tax=Microtetraspora sp. NBRC 16547 TaxID=3030993 RepID=UPI0024A0FC42|nr:DUF3618 domain-containing protein [Microtetraspora sp. NBRC 16547]GLW96828.1 hypothetical protein Misp02_09150 [Microtetraspora sp. NBRC 16547]